MKLISTIRKRYLIGIAVILTAVLVVYFWKDLHLEYGNKIPVPDMVVENIDVKRVIEGQNWRLKSPLVEHKDKVIYAKSLDIETVDKSSYDIKIKAVSGTFLREINDFTLIDAFGVMKKTNGTIYNLTSGKVFYEAKTEIWNFSNNVIISDDKTEISGPIGVYNTISGDMSLPNGGIVKWID